MATQRKNLFKVSLGITFVLTAMLLTQQLPSAQIAYASAPDRASETEERANAAWSKVISQTDTTTILQSTRLSVLQTSDEQTLIILNVDTSNLGAGEVDRLVGQVRTTDDVFSMDNNLASATLSQVQVELCPEDDQNEDGTCDVTPTTVLVQAEWTGVGHATKDRTTDTTDSTKVVTRTSSIDATASATINSESPGGLNSASLSKTITVTTTMAA